MPSRHERRKVSVEVDLVLDPKRASRTIGPQSSRSTSKVSRCGFSPESGVVSINLERLDAGCAGRRWPCLPAHDARFRVTPKFVGIGNRLSRVVRGT